MFCCGKFVYNLVLEVQLGSLSPNFASTTTTFSISFSLICQNQNSTNGFDTGAQNIDDQVHWSETKPLLTAAILITN